MQGGQGVVEVWVMLGLRGEGLCRPFVGSPTRLKGELLGDNSFLVFVFSQFDNVAGLDGARTLTLLKVLLAAFRDIPFDIGDFEFLDFHDGLISERHCVCQLE